jgi:cytidyltransferase-like protein
MNKKIGILGGTFNPIHNGHLELAKKAIKDFDLNFVLFVPTGNPPHKSSKDIAPKKHRLKMVQLAIGDSIKYKISKTERKVRKLDNPELNVADSAREVCKKTGINYRTCTKYIADLRRGVNDRIYSAILARENGFISPHERNSYRAAKVKIKNISLKGFRNEEAKRNKFKHTESYIRFLEDKIVFFQQEMKKESDILQKKFEYSALDFLDPDQLIKLNPKRETSRINPIDKEEFWKFMESTLTDEQYNVLYARFIENKTCKTIAKKLKCSNQRALQIEVETLKKLRHPVRLRVLEKEFC